MDWSNKQLGFFVSQQLMGTQNTEIVRDICMMVRWVKVMATVMHAGGQGFSHIIVATILTLKFIYFLKIHVNKIFGLPN